MSMYQITRQSCVTCGISLCCIDWFEIPVNPMRKFSFLYENLMAPPGDPLMCQLSIPPTFPKILFGSSGMENDDSGYVLTVLNKVKIFTD